VEVAPGWWVISIPLPGLELGKVHHAIASHMSPAHWSTVSQSVRQGELKSVKKLSLAVFRGLAVLIVEEISRVACDVGVDAFFVLLSFLKNSDNSLKSPKILTQIGLLVRPNEVRKAYFLFRGSISYCQDHVLMVVRTTCGMHTPSIRGHVAMLMLHYKHSC